MRNYPKALKRKLLDTMGLLTKPAYHWKYDIIKTTAPEKPVISGLPGLSVTNALLFSLL